jgi:hypothetical protein
MGVVFVVVHAAGDQVDLVGVDGGDPERDGHDLNTLAAPSALHLTGAQTIADRERSSAKARSRNGDLRNFVWIPNNK